MTKEMMIHALGYLLDNSKYNSIILEKTNMQNEYDIALKKKDDPACTMSEFDRTRAWYMGINNMVPVAELREDAEFSYIYDAANKLRHKIIEALNALDDLTLTRFYKRLSALQ